MNTLSFSVICALTFGVDLTTEAKVRESLGRFQKDNKILHTLFEIGFAFPNCKQGMTANLVAIDPISDFGLSANASHNEVLNKGVELGLSKCPSDTPIQFMLAAPNVPPGDYIFAVDAVCLKTDGGNAHVLTAFCFNDGVQLLDSCIYDSGDQPRRDNRKYLFMQE